MSGKERFMMYACSLCDWSGFTKESFDKHNCLEYVLEKVTSK